MIKTPPILVVASLIAIATTGCAHTSVQKRVDLPTVPKPGARIVVMPPDIELSELTAGGLLEPKAEWTESAKTHVVSAVTARLQTKQASLVPYRPPTSDPDREHRVAQLMKLHDAVGGAILIHKYGPNALHLPTKQNVFDWSLGGAVDALRPDHDADYALFVLFRDSYATSGRVALIVVGALVGVGVPSGRQIGFASLVDLKTGDIVWFNRLINPAGDLRTPEPATKAVDQLLADLPL